MKEVKRVSRIEDIKDVADTILKEKEYGDILSYAYLENLIGCNRTDFVFFYVISAVRNILIENGYLLRNMIEEGYRILYPNEIAEEVVQKYFKQGTDKFDKAVQVLRHTDTSLLNPSEFQFYEHILILADNVLNYNENALFEAQAKLNVIKAKELDK